MIIPSKVPMCLAGRKNSKLEFMRKLSAEKDIEFKDFVALGDGANDSNVKNSGLGIGYNSHKIIKDNIETQINFTDLTSVLYFLQIKKEDFIR